MPHLRDVTAVFVTFNSADVIARTLKAVPADMPVIVVDNASGDDTVKIARKVRPDALIRTNQTNTGFGTALNTGARLARTPFVLLLNPDVLISEQAVAALRGAAQAMPRNFLFGPAMTNRKGRAIKPPRPPLFASEHPLFKPFRKCKRDVQALPARACEVGWIVGAAMFVRREALRAIGGFDENIFLFFEETDLCHRAILAGQPPVWVPEATVTNLEGSSSGMPVARMNYFREWHFSWSQYYLLRKYNLGHLSWIQWSRPPAYFAKLAYYTLLRRKMKAAYYHGRLMGAIAALMGEPAPGEGLAPDLQSNAAQARRGKSLLRSV